MIQVHNAARHGSLEANLDWHSTRAMGMKQYQTRRLLAHIRMRQLALAREGRFEKSAHYAQLAQRLRLLPVSGCRAAG